MQYKGWIHSGCTGGGMWGGEQNAFLEAMAEAENSVVDYFGMGERALYINVMNHLNVDCPNAAMAIDHDSASTDAEAGSAMYRDSVVNR